MTSRTPSTPPNARGKVAPRTSVPPRVAPVRTATSNTRTPSVPPRSSAQVASAQTNLDFAPYRGPSKEGRKDARRFLALWAVAVLATGIAFVTHLALRFETVRLGYEVGRERRVQRELLDQRRVLSLEAATLKQPSRVETIARSTLSMDTPTSAQVVPMTGGASRAAGRVR